VKRPKKDTKAIQNEDDRATVLGQFQWTPSAEQRKDLPSGREMAEALGLDLEDPWN
jgi:hypothetical protein